MHADVINRVYYISVASNKHLIRVLKRLNAATSSYRVGHIILYTCSTFFSLSGLHILQFVLLKHLSMCNTYILPLKLAKLRSKNDMLELSQKIVEHIRTGDKPTEIVRHFNVSRVTLHKTTKLFEAMGDVKKRTSPGTPPSIRTEVMMNDGRKEVPQLPHPQGLPHPWAPLQPRQLCLDAGQDPHTQMQGLQSYLEFRPGHTDPHQRK